jgi:hypothetical protein
LSIPDPLSDRDIKLGAGNSAASRKAQIYRSPSEASLRRIISASRQSQRHAKIAQATLCDAHHCHCSGFSPNSRSGFAVAAVRIMLLRD